MLGEVYNDMLGAAQERLSLCRQDVTVCSRNKRIHGRPLTVFQDGSFQSRQSQSSSRLRGLSRFFTM